MDMWYAFVNWLARKRITELEGENKTLNIIVDDLDKEILEFRVAEINKKTLVPDEPVMSEQDIEDLDKCEVDFVAIRAVSIERNCNEFGNMVTIIGYLPKGSFECQEWFLDCSSERHAELVTQFNAFKTKLTP